MTSIQCGAALATTLFDRVGAGGAVFLRLLLGAVVLMIAWRPGWRPSREQLWPILLFGLSLGLVSWTFFEAIARIPLGTTVTIEFLGPLTVAVIGSRRRIDLLWVLMAAVGVVMLTGGIGGSSLDPVGVGMALAAAFFWGMYILVGTRIGGDTSGGGPLAQAMVVATLITLPMGLGQGGFEVFTPAVLVIGLGVALLSAAIPFSLEFEAMRRLPSNVFGVMMSIEPALGALVGFIALGQGVKPVQALAIGLVVAASAGALGSSRTPATVEP